MPRDPRRSGAWMAPPRHLLVWLAVLASGATAALGWMGWQMLRQERDVESQRAQERLEHHADRIVQELERHLGDIDSRLTEWLSIAETPERLKAAALGGGAVMSRSMTHPVPPGVLVFHPAVPSRPEPSADLFYDAERDEFQRRNYAAAARTLRRIAQSPDRTVRAAALIRLARVHVTAGRPSEALRAYDELEALGEVSVIGLPADLVARTARARLLSRQGRDRDAHTTATAVLADLRRARWALARGQYEHYVEEAATIAAVSRPRGPEVVLAEAMSAVWSEWLAQPLTQGRRIDRFEELPLLIVWRGTPDRVAVWAAAPAELLAHLALDPAVAVTMTDAAGVIAGEGMPGHRPAIRTAAETRLPLTLHVSHAAAPAAVPMFSRGHWIVAGLAVMVTFLVAGSYFIGRAITHEMQLARLQSDFVAAVSHEFRTPLAAMRQLSELLAGGRVPDAQKRQHYYESLAGESRRLQRLVEGLLDFGRLEAGAKPYRLEPLDPRALVEDVVNEYRAQIARPDCRIEMVGRSDSPALLGDREAVALAVHNLIDNAVKYGGGAGPVRVAWEPRGDRIALSVRDEGPGIAPDEQRRIFHKFVRGAAASAANVRGTGVGLAMVELVATGHGGAVIVQSRPGAGATFTMLLPMANAS